MFLKRFLLLLLTTVAFNSYASSVDGYLVTQLTTADGLSQNDVQAIIQDSYGYIWCATDDGLCRYDGYEFKCYSIGDRGLDANIIYAISEDGEGNLWVGTSGGGLYYYLRSENRFYHHTQLLGGEDWIGKFAVIKYVEISDDGSIWFFNINSREMINFTFNSHSKSVEDIYVYDFFKDQEDIFVTKMLAVDDDLYVGTSKGLFFYSNKNSGFELCNPNLQGYVNSVERKGDKLFIGNTYYLRSLDLKSGALSSYGTFEFLQRICWVGDDLCFGERNGLYTRSYDPVKNQFGEAKIVAEYRNQIIRSIMVNNVGDIWVGYRQMGLCRYERTKQIVERHQGVGNDHISQMIIDSNDNLWIGTLGSGLFISNIDDPYTSLHRHLRRGVITAITYMPYNKKYYVATATELIETESIDMNRSSSVLPIISGVGKMTPDGYYLWMSIYGQGLWRYDVNTREYIALRVENGLPSNVIRTHLLDSKGNLWVCTDRGIAMLEADSRSSASPKVSVIQHELTHRHLITSIAEDCDGNIWYGTNGRGVCKLTPQGDGDSYDLKIFNEESGLPDNVVKSIILTKSGELWLSTKKSICSIDPRGEVIKNLDINKVDQGHEFNEQSLIELPNGVLLFGGVNGITQVLPENLNVDTSEPQPVIADLRIFNESVLDTDEYMHLIPSLLDPQRGVKLKYNQNKISFTLSALDFTNSNSYRYRYFLQGLDRDRSEVSAERREVVYTNVSPGSYTFIVEVSNGDGKWSEAVLQMPIRVRPPFWAAWYSYLFYLLLIALWVVVALQYFKRRMVRKNAIKLAKSEQKRMREMMEMRTRFFTNISHEFRTPLTLILSPLQQIMADEEFANNPKLKSPLKVMYNNGSSLMRLISELLNYTKQESGKLKVELQYHNFTKTSLKAVEQFKYWTDQRGQILESKIPSHSIKFLYDKHLMEQIIYNLMSNAIKHTPKGGVVSYTVEDSESEILFSVRDTGAGIDESIGAHLFERFYSLNASANSETGGTGIGLSLSKSLVALHKGKIWYTSIKGEGATFYVSIPKVQLSEPEGVEEEQLDVADEPLNIESYEDQPSATSSDGSKPLMLLVDDNSDMLTLLTSLFERRYNIVTALDGQEGIDKALELIPDMIISDVMMPKVSGLELCDRLKHNQDSSHIPIVLLTAKTQERDVIEGYRTQADAYCTKPFSNAVLKERVKSILENRRKVAQRIINYRPEVSGSGEKRVESVATPIEENITTQIDKEFLTKLTEFIEQNINNSELSVSDVCMKMGVTQLILNKKLKSLLNITANALIRSIRIKHAAALLRTGRYTVADVTYDVGFSDLRYFRECFKKEFGDSPQSYKDKFSKIASEEQA